jgi:hypothetical protein
MYSALFPVTSSLFHGVVPFMVTFVTRRPEYSYNLVESSGSEESSGNSAEGSLEHGEGL